MTEQEKKDLELAEQIITHLDADGGYIQLMADVYVQTQEDAIADSSDFTLSETVELFKAAPYWIVCAPELPIAINGAKDLAEFLGKYSIITEDLDF